MCHCNLIHIAIAKKINKKMIIVDGDEVIYNMPYWIQIRHRRDLEELADCFNQANKRCIDCIIEFETKFSVVKKK
jgi:hypothetical protein